MNCGEILQACYYTLGEPMPPSLENPNAGGTWKIGEMLYWLNQSQNEHAQRALSVKNIVYTTAVRGQVTYAFPEDFGELCSIRYHDDYGSDRELTYVPRRVIRDWNYTGTEFGDPVCYYREQSDIGDVYGLFPQPYKPLVFEYGFEDTCPHFSPYLDRSVTPHRFFENYITVQLTPEAGAVVNGRYDLNPNCVYICYVGVYLKREGTYYPGELWMEFQAYPLEENYIHVSGPYPAEEINARAEWVLFDFTQNPIELTPEEKTYQLRLLADDDYVDADPNRYGGQGVVVGTHVPKETQPPAAFLEMHRLRGDIEVEYYRNVCDELLAFDQIPNVKARYHPTLVKQVLEKAYLKNGYDLTLSARFGAEASGEIELARAQAYVPTIGPRSEIRRPALLQPNIRYLGDNRFRLRFGSYRR